METLKSGGVFTLSAAAYFHEYMTSKLNAVGNYPISEVDVDARIYETLVEEDRYEADEQPLDDYIASLRKIAAGAPDGAEVVIEFERDWGYDDDSFTVLKVGYWREPTPEERAEREAHNREAREHNAALGAKKAAEAAERERAEFERLRAKFEPR